MGYRIGDFPVTEDYADRALSIPMYPTLTLGEVEFVIEKVRECIS
jgi:dTDP-4-amino-4,6-dideoxygalactose transaminase